jgi:hypothetical protein
MSETEKSPELPVKDEVLERHTRLFVSELTEVLRPVQASSNLAVSIGQSNGARLTAIEQRLSLIERHIGLNGRAPLADTEPAPATQPDLPVPEE